MPIKKFLKDVETLKAEHRPRNAQRPAPRHDDESNWLVSYADMMTLLCGFFIMLFTLSHIDEPKFEKAKESIAKSFGGKYDKPSEELQVLVTQTLVEGGVDKIAKVTSDGSGLQIDFESTFYFDTLNAELKPEARVALLKVIQKLAEHQVKIYKEYPITIEGHTDARPITGGVYASNWELSGARAARIARLFLEQGFSAEKLTPIGFADSRPLAPSRLPNGEWDEAALNRNRRVVIRIARPIDRVADKTAIAAPPMPAANPPAATAVAPPQAPAAVVVQPPAVIPPVQPTAQPKS